MTSSLPNVMDANFNLRVYTTKEVEQINEQLTKTRSHRVRAAMFPETLEDPESHLPVTQLHYDMPTAIQILAEPSRDLKEAIADLIAYQLDADFAAKFLPEITRLLGDGDEDVVRNAAELTNGLTESEAACTVINHSPQLVSALLRAAGKGNGESRTDQRIKEATAAAVLNLVKNEAGRLTLFKSGGIEFLVRLLSVASERIVFYAISALHSLLNHQEGAKVAVRTAGGIQRMVPLLRWKEAKFLAIVIDCLHLLAFGDSEAKIAIWNCKGPRELVALFNKTHDEKLVWTASRLLKVLSTCPHSKEMLVESGAIEAVAARLNEKDVKLLTNYFVILRNLSDAEADFRCDTNLIHYLLRFYKSPDEQVVVYIAGIFENLSSDKPALKQTIFQCGGVEVLLHALMKVKREDVIEPALCTLRHLTSQHFFTHQVQSEMRKLGGLELTIQHLQLATTWPIIKAATGLVRNLLNCEENHATLVDLKIIPRLGQLLALAVKEERQNRNKSKTSVSSESSSNTEKIDSMNEIVESAIVSLTLLCNSSMINRDNIVDLNVGPLIVKLRQDETGSAAVLTACTDLLAELKIGTPNSDSLAYRRSLNRQSSLGCRHPQEQSNLAAVEQQPIYENQSSNHGPQTESAQADVSLSSPPLQNAQSEILPEGVYANVEGPNSPNEKAEREYDSSSSEDEPIRLTRKELRRIKKQEKLEEKQRKKEEKMAAKMRQPIAD